MPMCGRTAPTGPPQLSGRDDAMDPRAGLSPGSVRLARRGPRPWRVPVCLHPVSTEVTTSSSRSGGAHSRTRDRSPVRRSAALQRTPYLPAVRASNGQWLPREKVKPRQAARKPWDRSEPGWALTSMCCREPAAGGLSLSLRKQLGKSVQVCPNRASLCLLDDGVSNSSEDAAQT